MGRCSSCSLCFRRWSSGGALSLRRPCAGRGADRSLISTVYVIAVVSGIRPYQTIFASLGVRDAFLFSFEIIPSPGPGDLGSALPWLSCVETRAGIRRSQLPAPKISTSRTTFVGKEKTINLVRCRNFGTHYSQANMNPCSNRTSYSKRSDIASYFCQTYFLNSILCPRNRRSKTACATSVSPNPQTSFRLLAVAILAQAIWKGEPPLTQLFHCTPVSFA